jgi:hypothetical protein
LLQVVLCPLAPTPVGEDSAAITMADVKGIRGLLQEDQQKPYNAMKIKRQ